jgi:predicted metal-binding protein
MINRLITKDKLVINYKVRGLCTTPYPNHPKGCPNFYKNRPDCPPQAPKIEDFFDLHYPIGIVYVTLDFLSHRNKMKQLHPKWSDRQVDCCLYWQPKLNKLLKEKVYEGLRQYHREICSKRASLSCQATFCPEAMGVNVTASMKNIGITLEWPPKNIVRKVALIGVKK